MRINQPPPDATPNCVFVAPSDLKDMIEYDIVGLRGPFRKKYNRP